MGVRENPVKVAGGDYHGDGARTAGWRLQPAIPPAFWLWFAGLWFLSGFAFRVYVAFTLQEESVGGRLLAVLTGFVSDLQVLFLVFGWLGAGLLVGARFARWWLGMTLALVSLIFIADSAYWLEFQSRFGRFVLHYAEYPREVAIFLNEQFFVAVFLLPFAALVWLATRWAGRWLPGRLNRSDRLVCALWILLGAVVAGYGTPGVPGHSRHLHHLGSNGFLGALKASRVDRSVWHGVYWSPDPETVDLAGSTDAVGSGGSAEPDRGLADAVRSRIAPGAGFRHVVLIIEESLGGRFWRDRQLRARYMPRLQALAQGGISFESVYATGGFTIRGLEAILNGFPPLPGMVITTEPRLEKLPSLPRELRRAGFYTSFVYGGWPGFTSFHEYWRRIGFDEMLSRFDFEDRWFETSWGVADEILFARVLEEMDRLSATHERVMLATLTVSNHRPFDFPQGRIDLPADERRRENVIAYADWALGEFFAEAEARPWFDDTLFVIAVDHGPEHQGPALVPAPGYQVPLVLYSPGKLPPAVLDHHGSIMSLAVTLFDLLDITPQEPFYGSNLLAGDGPVPVELHHEIGLLGRDRMTVLVRRGGLLGWRYDGQQLIADEPDLEQAIAAEALFRGAHEHLYGQP